MGNRAKILTTEVVSRKNQAAYAVFTVPSDSNPSKTYRVDVTNGRCDCPAWKFQRAVDGHRKPCKHLRALGYTENTVVKTKTENDYSKVL